MKPNVARQWYEIRNQGSGGAEVWIYEEIGESFWGEGISAKKFVEELNALDVAGIDLHINSYGGSVFEGQAIYNALVRHPAAVTTYIDGIAGSIASVIALAGETIIMPSNAMMMIHNPLGMVVGYAEEMRAYADTLDKVRDIILNVYEEHSSKTRDELSDAMAAETWLTAADAVEYGFIAEVAAPLKMAAHIDPAALARFKNAPPELAIEPPTPVEAAEAPAMAPAEDALPERDWVAVARLGRTGTFAPRQQQTAQAQAGRKGTTDV